jgi:hypothetical protein
MHPMVIIINALNTEQTNIVETHVQKTNRNAFLRNK